MDYIENAKGKVFRLKEYLDNYIDNPDNYNLKKLESFFEELGFYIKNDEANEKNYKIKINKLKYFLSNLITIIQSNMEYSKKQDIINIFATIQAEFQQPRNEEYKNVYILDHNKRQYSPFGHFHLELSQKINKKYENITNTKINNKTTRRNRNRSRDKSITTNRSRTRRMTRNRTRSRNISRSRSRSRSRS
jgi:hypothetical protein